MSQHRMPFGMFKGRLLSDLPDDYLEWLLTIDLRDPLRTHVEAEIEDREAVATKSKSIGKDERRMAEEIITTGFRAMAKVHHPDKGGSTKAMQALNAANQWLKNIINGESGS